MRPIDWIVLIGTLVTIVAYGVWKGRHRKNLDGYLLAGRQLKWPTIALSIMATQASAITFLSTPGQAYADGMRFVQFYLGLPIAMVILSITAVPIYHRLQIFTAYEYLETRFGVGTRTLTSILFLIQRGLSTGITLYAPALIVSVILGWNIHLTNVVVGLTVVLYTATGGTRAVSRTQVHQLLIALGGMAVALIIAIHSLPHDVTLVEAFRVAGRMGRLNAIDFKFDLKTPYNFWSGLIGGAFLALSYFGTDQSQVQRYLGGTSTRESRIGLLFNALIKVPMQFLILMVGIAVVVFHQFERPPLLWNGVAAAEARRAPEAARKLDALELRLGEIFETKRAAVMQLLAGDTKAKAEILKQEESEHALRKEARAIVRENAPPGQASDADSIFLTFVLRHFPPGLLGLLLAVIICAALSATASALNALGATTVVDFLKPQTDEARLRTARLFTVVWGIVAMSFAAFASLLDNLIQAVNILGSIFYGPMLGVFLVGWAMPRVRGTPAFIATLAAQAFVITLWLTTSVGFLWYNVAGCTAVVMVALLLQAGMPGAAQRS
jgi:solute:Na+ symporter, SSS family